MGKDAKPLKIALVVYSWSQTQGGVERHVFDLARGLVARGHDVHVWSRRRDGDFPGVTFHTVPGSGVGPGKYTSFAREAERVVPLPDFDAVHGFGRAFSQDLLRVGGGCHQEYLRHTHDGAPGPVWMLFHPKDRAILRLEREVFSRRCWRRLVCISKGVAEEVHRVHGIPLEECLVIHNGTDTSVFHPRHRVASPGPVRLLFAGSGFERKGLEQALEALARVSGDWKLRVVGKGDAGRYAGIAAKFGIGARVEFAGPQRDMPAEYGSADALVFPTLYDAFGTVTLEAMATGIPVIVSRQAGSSEVVTHRADGLIVEDPRDPAELALALDSLVSDAPRREAMGAAARISAERHTMDAVIDRNLVLYREIAKEKGRG